jgi:hypothetical protein
MATIVLHNYAGAGCNLVKYLSWTLLYSANNKVLFYYRNKKVPYDANDNPNVFFIEKFEDFVENNLFYKLFQYPEGCSPESFVPDAKFTLSFPSEYPINRLPPCLANYPTLFPTNIKGDTVSLLFTSRRTFYTDPLLPAIRQAYFEQIQKNLRFQPWFQQEIQKELQVIQDFQKEGKTVLSVFLRSSQHFIESIFSFDTLFEEISKHLQKYDYVFITTQIESLALRAKEIFGDKVIRFERKRLPGDIDWNKNVSDEEFEEEVKMAIIDSYLMSQCDAILSGLSNMLLMSIFFNPTVPFTLYETIKGETAA